jgi:predicted RNA binding protein YcfA (HicA-like mRNA interferase family)
MEAMGLRNSLSANEVRDVIKAMEKDGSVLDRTRGDHRRYVNPVKPEAERLRSPVIPAATCQPRREVRKSPLPFLHRARRVFILFGGPPAHGRSAVSAR